MRFRSIELWIALFVWLCWTWITFQWWLCHWLQPYGCRCMEWIIVVEAECETYRYIGAARGPLKLLACILVLTKSNGWNISVEHVALNAPAPRATSAPCPLFSLGGAIFLGGLLSFGASNWLEIFQASIFKILTTAIIINYTRGWEKEHSGPLYLAILGPSLGVLLYVG